MSMILPSDCYWAAIQISKLSIWEVLVGLLQFRCSVCDPKAVGKWLHSCAPYLLYLFSETNIGFCRNDLDR